MSLSNTYSQHFEHILTLIQEARNRIYSKANSELVLLYFNVGKVVSDRVSTGIWGENTVQQLADFIQSKIPNLSGFNRRGLYRMKQFFELYTPDSEVFKLWLNTINSKVSPTATLIENIEKDDVNLKKTALFGISVLLRFLLTLQIYNYD